MKQLRRPDLDRDGSQTWSKAEHRRRIKYGITPLVYHWMEVIQGHVCAGCGRLPKRGLCVDHCHRTNINRGLLCHSCNSALGMAKDRPDTLRNLANYLEIGPKIPDNVDLNGS